MKRTLFYGTILGAALLGVSCNEQLTPTESKVYPSPVYATREPEGPTSRFSGYTVDAEAFFINLANCGATCPFPPLYNDQIPLYYRSVVRDASITALDLATGTPVNQSGVSGPTGAWSVAKVPSRENPPYFVMTKGGPGTLANDAPLPPEFVLPDVPTGNYVPTITFRPISPVHGICVGIEAIQISDIGIMEAIAKNLSLTGPNTVTVSDLLDPTKFAGISVFWLYHPGFGFLKAPADNTTLEATSGQVLNIEWAPPGALPPELTPFQSTRGFFAPPGAPTSSLGLVAVVHTGTPPAEPVTYTAKDTVTDAANLRPWNFPPLPLPVIPGAVFFTTVQFMTSQSAPPGLIPPSACAPKE
jgi:hypothetical protein